MNFYFSELVTAPARLPITVDAADKVLAAAVVQELELYLGRAIVAQTRRVLIDGDLPPRIEIEPTTSIVSLTRWTEDDDAEVIDDTEYNFVFARSGGLHNRTAPPRRLARTRAINRQFCIDLRVRMGSHRLLEHGASSHPAHGRAGRRVS